MIDNPRIRVRVHRFRGANAPGKRCTNGGQGRSGYAHRQRPFLRVQIWENGQLTEEKQYCWKCYNKILPALRRIDETVPALKTIGIRKKREVKSKAPESRAVAKT